MRAAISVLVLTACGYACATATEDSNPDPPRTDPLPGDATVDGGSEAAPDNDRCSADGWCVIDSVDELLRDGRTTLIGIWGSGQDDVWAVGSNGTILHWDGSRWSPAPWSSPDGGLPPTFRGVWGTGPADVWVYGTGATILHSQGWTDGGGSVEWSPATQSPWTGRLGAEQPIVNSIWGSSPADIWMAVKDSPAGLSSSPNHVYHGDGWNHGNLNWSPTVTHYRDMYMPLKLWGSSSADVWAAGMRGRTLRTTGEKDGGVDWEIIENATDVDLNTLWGFGPDDVWAAGAAGTICHFTHDDVGDLQWTVSRSGVSANLLGGWGSGPTDLWVVGAEGTILHGDGASWARSLAPPLPPSTTLYGIWGTAPDDVWAVGDGVILHRTHGGSAP